MKLQLWSENLQRMKLKKSCKENKKYKCATQRSKIEFLSPGSKKILHHLSFT